MRRCERHVVFSLDELDRCDLEEGCSWRVYRGEYAYTFAVGAKGVSITAHRVDEAGRCAVDLATYHAPFHRVRLNNGSEQRLVGCPAECGRRHRILYAVDERCGCKWCLNLRNHSQSLGERDRIWYRVMKIRRRIDPNASGDEFPERRPRMKWRVYREMVALDNVLRSDFPRPRSLIQLKKLVTPREAN